MFFFVFFFVAPSFPVGPRVSPVACSARDREEARTPEVCFPFYMTVQ